MLKIKGVLTFILYLLVSYCRILKMPHAHTYSDYANKGSSTQCTLRTQNSIKRFSENSIKFWKVFLIFSSIEHFGEGYCLRNTRIENNKSA